MQQKRYFEFETLVGTDENGQVKIELGTERLNGLRFDATFKEPEIIKAIFNVINYFTVQKQPKYTRSLVAYKDWYTNEIIRRLTEDTTYFDQKSEAKKEVLKEAMQRRNSLLKQINKAMTHYNDAKVEIDRMEKMRAIYQYPFPGPMVALLDDLLVFENLNEHEDIYYQINLELPEAEEYHERENGFGWMEYSRVFGDEVLNLPLTASKTVHLTNNKPRSDMRVLRRGDRSPSQLFRVSDHFGTELMNQKLAIWYFNQNQEFQLDKGQVYTLVSRIIGSFRENEEIILSVVAGDSHDFSVISKENELVLYVKSETDIEFSYPVNTSIFYSLRNSIYLINVAKFTVPTFNFGMSISFTVDKAEIFLNSNSLKSSRNRYLRNFVYKLGHFQDIGIHEPSNSYLFSTKEGMTISGQGFYREAHGSIGEKSQREREALLLLSIHSKAFSIGDNELNFEWDTIQSRIKVPYPLNQQDFTCNCGKVHPKYLCSHLLALLTFGYKEDKFVAG